MLLLTRYLDNKKITTRITCPTPDRQLQPTVGVTTAPVAALVHDSTPESITTKTANHSIIGRDVCPLILQPKNKGKVTDLIEVGADELVPHRIGFVTIAVSAVTFLENVGNRNNPGKLREKEKCR